MKWNVFIGQQHTMLQRLKARRPPGGPGDRAVDAGEGVVVKKKRVGTLTKKMRLATWQQRGNWGTLQNQNQGLARGRNKMMSSKSRPLIYWTKKMMTLIGISNLCPKNEKEP